MLRGPALTAINAYQRCLSPRKGYGCAYRPAHGGTGWSGFAKHTIAERGLIRAIPEIMHRFAQCKKADLALSADSTKGTETAKEIKVVRLLRPSRKLLPPARQERLCHHLSRLHTRLQTRLLQSLIPE